MLHVLLYILLACAYSEGAFFHFYKRDWRITIREISIAIFYVGFATLAAMEHRDAALTLLA